MCVYAQSAHLTLHSNQIRDKRGVVDKRVNRRESRVVKHWRHLPRLHSREHPTVCEKRVGEGEKEGVIEESQTHAHSHKHIHTHASRLQQRLSMSGNCVRVHSHSQQVAARRRGSPCHSLSPSIADWIPKTIATCKHTHTHRERQESGRRSDRTRVHQSRRLTGRCERITGDPNERELLCL